MKGEHSLTLVIGALGGEGGGVLADWVVETAHHAGYPVQATSIPGVAQRTGATTYYIEIFPVKRADLAGRSPVMCLAPSAGQVDVLLYSELVETARAIQTGLVSKRTTLIASTHRVYLTTEKMAMGDGRFDAERGIAAARAVAKAAILFDMEEETAKAGTVISAVMFGALIGSAALPLARAHAERAIRAGGKGVEGSLKGFAAGYARAAEDGTSSAVAAPKSARMRPARLATATLVARVDAEIPTACRDIASLGVERCIDYQDGAYASLYLDRLQPVQAFDRAHGGGPDFAVTRETARFLALWMCYEDVARVADLKSRLDRFDGIRKEAAIGNAEPIRVVEFFKPGYDEVADQLPNALADRVRAFAKKRGRISIFDDGIHVTSTSLIGYLQLRLMAAMGRLRRRSSRYLQEQALIRRWLCALVAAPNRELALEIAQLGRLIKGYSDTHRRGKENFLRIMDSLVEGGAYADDTRLTYLRAARAAAMADPDGQTLDMSLKGAGIAPRTPKSHPVKFYPRRTESK